jgi:hypothetical protein
MQRKERGGEGRRWLMVRLMMGSNSNSSREVRLKRESNF